MLDETLVTAEQIKLRQGSIDRLLASLAGNIFTQDDLLRIYTVLGDAGEYDDYVGKIYTSPPSVSFEDITGTGAAATAVLTDGILTAVDVTDGGLNYTPDVIVNFSGGGGNGAAAHALVSGSGDSISSVIVDNVSLVSRLVNKNFDLDDEFAAL